MENNQEGGGSKRIYILIIVLLLLINGVAFYLLYNENKAKNDLGSQNTELNKDLDSLKTQFDAKIQELEQYRGKNAELDSVINEKESEIEKQKQQIGYLASKGRLDASEKAKAKEMIAADEASIADLQKKVEELTKQNQQLTNQNEQLNSDLSAEKKTTQQLTSQNQGLSKKVELGSLLQLRNITVEGIAKKKNGKEVTEKKVKHVESLKVSFETGDNKVLETGPLSLFVRVLTPKGETISVADQGSGTLKDASTGTDIQYTKKADIDWTQANKKVEVYWSQNIKDAGTYKVEIYQSGYLIGKGQVELK